LDNFVFTYLIKGSKFKWCNNFFENLLVRASLYFRKIACRIFHHFKRHKDLKNIIAFIVLFIIDFSLFFLFYLSLLKTFSSFSYKVKINKFVYIMTTSIEEKWILPFLMS